MRINVGSANPIKILAVRDFLWEHGVFPYIEVKGVKVESEVSQQPKTLRETVIGARCRAKNAFQNCDLSFGLEDGLMEIPAGFLSKTGYANVCVCAIYDGNEYYPGFSSAYEHPKEAIKPDGGSREGPVGILTRGLYNRTDNIKGAIRMALIQFDHPELY